MAEAILLFCFQGAGRALKRPGDLVQRGRKNRVLLGFVHQVRAGRALKRSGDLVQRGRKNRVLLGFVHQVRAGRALKRSGDLVQMERKNKALRGSVHQVRAVRGLKMAEDLVQMERKDKTLRGFVHQVRTEKIGKAGMGGDSVRARFPAKPINSVFVREPRWLRRAESRPGRRFGSRSAARKANKFGFHARTPVPRRAESRPAGRHLQLIRRPAPAAHPPAVKKQ